MDRFGFKVALSNDGSTLVVSAPSYGGVGAVFVYEYNAGSSTWSQKGDGIFAPVDVSITSSFGSSISITSNANRILVGCESKNQVYLYEYISNNWTQIAPPINSENDSAFGKHVKLDAGGTKALCVSNNLARVFEYDGSTSWSLHGNAISLVNGDVVRMSQDTNTIAIVNSINYNMDIYSYNSYNDYYAIDESLSFAAISSDLFAADVDISGDGALVSIGASGYVNNSGYVATYKNNKDLHMYKKTVSIAPQYSDQDYKYMVADTSRNRLYVLCDNLLLSQRSTVAVIDLSSNMIIDEIPLGFNGGVFMAIDSSNTNLYILCSQVVDPSAEVVVTGKLFKFVIGTQTLTNIDISGITPQRLYLNESEDKLYIAGDDELQVLTLSTLADAASYKVNGFYYGETYILASLYDYHDICSSSGWIFTCICY